MEITRNGSQPSIQGPADWFEHVSEDQYAG